MSFTATATGSRGSLEFDVDVNGRHEMVTDEPVSLGGTDLGPAPHELLPAAIASCVAVTMSMYARRKGWDLGDLAVDVDYDNEATPRRVEVVLHLSDQLSAEQRERLERVAASCPLRRSLEAGFVFAERTTSTARPAGG